MYLPFLFPLFALPQLEVSRMLHRHDLFQTQRLEQRHMQLKLRPQCRINRQNHKDHGVHPVIECTQNIPCNPCQDACKFGCILVGKQITNIPVVDRERKCTGCGMCVASCSGQAIFLVNDDFEEERSTVTLAYEFLPYPEKGQTGHGFGIGPITGLLLSELLLDGKTSTLPIDAFRYDRFGAHK